ncbi:MAG: hypothetical protein HYR91_05295 [Flavobacteriia bacterium]|nr:hypothetical protein [Flavobacteriia bacterium]
MKQGIIILLMIMFFSECKAQSILQPKHTFNIEVGLPVTMANRPFKWMMQGVVNSSMYYQFRLPNNLAFGAGINYSLFSINVVRVKPSIKGSLYNFGGFIKIAHEKFHSETFGTDFGVKIGYGQTVFKDSLLVDQYSSKMYSISSINLTPMIGFKLMADEANAFSFTFGYTFNDFNFYPARLGYTPQGYTLVDFQGSTQFMTVGFGYTHFIGRKAE